MNYKDQAKVLYTQVQEYRERLYKEETMRSKIFMELERYHKKNSIQIDSNKNTEI